MRVLVKSGDESYVLSARIALEAAGIPFVAQDRMGGPYGNPISILVEDADYDQARVAIGDLQQTGVRPTDGATRRIAPWAVGVALLLIGMSLVLARLFSRS
jgi:hypothetical protein